MRDSAVNKARHSDGFSVAASPPLQNRACWQRYEIMRNLIPVLAILASSMVSAYEDIPCSEDTDDHGHRLSILAASVKAYIAEHGKWPPEVGDLIPIYLDKNAQVLEAAPVTFIAEKNLIVSGSCLLEETADMRSIRVCFYNIETNESNCELE